MWSAGTRSTYLLIERNLLHEGSHSIGQVGLPGANGSGSTQSEVVVEAMAKSAPGIKETLQAPAHIANITIECRPCMLMIRMQKTQRKVPIL